MKVLSVAALTSLALPLVVGRNCPVESTCIQEECSNFQISKITGAVRTRFPFVSNGRAPMLEADCKDRWGTKVFTYLPLDNCIVNAHGDMYWAPNGDSNCYSCNIKERKADSDPVIMKCMCPDNKKGNSEINLSEGIWHYDGVIGCHNYAGVKRPINPLKKRSLPELPADASTGARDEEQLGPHVITAADFVESSHRRAPANFEDAATPAPVPVWSPAVALPKPELPVSFKLPGPKAPARGERPPVGGPKARDEDDAEETRRFRRF